ncbi:MAG: TetR/AcrR family transcriptional regulator [Myxococcales bacterium]|nr:TetR/AcrR family transcriptional regulator [Myxococcales bacterium]
MREKFDVPRRPGRPSHPIGRDRLLRIALDAFARLGYGATSLGTVAERSGLRRASLYHHFATKEAMYQAVLDEVVSDLRKLVLAARLQSGRFEERLDRLGELVTEYLGRQPSAARLLLRELVEGRHYLFGAGRQHVRLAFDLIEAFLDAGMREGAFRRQDTRQLAMSIVGLHLFYFAASDLLRGLAGGADPFSPEQIASRKRALRAQVRALCLPAAASTRTDRSRPARKIAQPTR